MSRTIHPKIFSYLVALAVLACGPSADVIVKTADGVGLTAADVDRDPLALLPGGAAVAGALDAQALFASPVGARLLALVQSRMPLPPEAQFEPRRDLDKLYLGFYSLQGADFAGVAQGRFNGAAIEAAADGLHNTPLGEPLVRVEYAGRRFFVSGGLGFVVLTERTVAFGNETGIRRVLDRLEMGRIVDELPAPLSALLREPGAPMALGIDPVSTPHVQAFSSWLPWLDGLQLGRIVGDFEAPGINLAGTLTYPDPVSAAAGQGRLDEMGQRLQTYSWLASIVGLGQPLKRLDSQVVDQSVQFAAALDSQVASALLDQLNAAAGMGP